MDSVNDLNAIMCPISHDVMEEPMTLECKIN